MTKKQPIPLPPDRAARIIQPGPYPDEWCLLSVRLKGLDRRELLQLGSGRELHERVAIAIQQALKPGGELVVDSIVLTPENPG